MNRFENDPFINQGLNLLQSGKAPRYELISWLCQNDRNGVYKDDDHIQEFERIATHQELMVCLENQLQDYI